MAYQARMGAPFTLLHPVRDINDAYVAGQAASVTKTLLGPDRLAAPAELATAVLTDFVTGWVQVTLTLTRLGSYSLELTNPGSPTADGRTQPYDIVVAAGIATSATLLTSRDRVRTRMQLKNGAGQPIQPSDAHPFDSLIDLLISEVSDEYQRVLGRTFAETSYTEYLSGTYRPSLLLGAGPLVSVSSVNSVVYQDDGAGGVTEVLTLVPRSTYLLSGMRTTPGFLGRGRLDLVSGAPWRAGGGFWIPGTRNYKVVYTAGFDVIPEAIVGLATSDVVYRLCTRDTAHLLSQSLGDGSISYLRPQQMSDSREAGLAPYLLEAA